MASRDKVDVDMFHKSIQYALEKLGKSKSGFERTVVSKFKRKRRVGSGNELVDYSRAPCLGADQKTRGLWERDWNVLLHLSRAGAVVSWFNGGLMDLMRTSLNRAVRDRALGPVSRRSRTISHPESRSKISNLI